MNKVIIIFLLCGLALSGTVSAEVFSSTPKKKTSLEKRMKKQAKKKKKKGDQGCPKIDC